MQFINKKNKLLIHETLWLNLKTIILSEGSLKQKRLYFVISFISSKKGKTKLWLKKQNRTEIVAERVEGWD